MKVALVNEDFGSAFPAKSNMKLAVITYLLRRHVYPLRITKYMDIEQVKHEDFVIDLDDSNQGIMHKLDLLLHTDNPDIIFYKDYTRKYRLLEIFNGSMFRIPMPYSKRVSNGLLTLLSDIDHKQVSKDLSPSNIGHSLLGHYMHLLYDTRIARKNRRTIEEYINYILNGKQMKYFKSICKKYSIMYNPGEYIECRPYIDIMLKLAKYKKPVELPRSTVVKMLNRLEIGYRPEGILYKVIRYGLEGKVVFSIYRHWYCLYDANSTPKFKQGQNVLVDIIANETKENKGIVKDIKEVAKYRYPGIPLVVNIKWLKKDELLG